MSEVVPVLSVAFSGTVALAGVFVTAYGARAQRRWQAREERQVEFRGVLDAAGEHLGRTAKALEVALDRLYESRDIDDANRHLGTADDGHREMLVMLARIRVRLGHGHPVANAYDLAACAADRLALAIRERFAKADAKQLWAGFELVQREFFDAAARALGSPTDV
jgi:hypothetical protein